MRRRRRRQRKVKMGTIENAVPLGVKMMQHSSFVDGGFPKPWSGGGVASRFLQPCPRVNGSGRGPDARTVEVKKRCGPDAGVAVSPTTLLGGNGSVFRSYIPSILQVQERPAWPAEKDYCACPVNAPRGKRQRTRTGRGQDVGRTIGIKATDADRTRAWSFLPVRARDAPDLFSSGKCCDDLYNSMFLVPDRHVYKQGFRGNTHINLIGATLQKS
eukprot:gene11622-biopygen13946